MPYVSRLSRLLSDHLRVFAIGSDSLTEATSTPGSSAALSHVIPSRPSPRLTIYPMMSTHQPVAARSRGYKTRRGLLKAAKTLFLLKGLATVTVDDICLAAHVSKGGFYHHFPDKESTFLEVALEELRREMGLSAPPAPDIARGRGASALLLDLWAWAPQRPQACRWVRAVHRRALRQLSKLADQAACGTPPTGDREAQAALALLVGIGRVVQRATARYPATSEHERGKAAAG